MLGVAASFMAPLDAVAAHPPAFPGKPVRIIVGYGAGTATDTVARVIKPTSSAGLRPCAA
jgi:tripartite-type tricarboxylate transporter receptor subunit TctC